MHQARIQAAVRQLGFDALQRLSELGSEFESVEARGHRRSSMGVCDGRRLPRLAGALRLRAGLAAPSRSRMSIATAARLPGLTPCRRLAGPRLWTRDSERMARRP